MGVSSIAVGSLLAVVAAWYGLQEYGHRAAPPEAPGPAIEAPPEAPAVAIEAPPAPPEVDPAVDASGPEAPTGATPAASPSHVAKKPKPADPPAPVVDPGVAATIELFGNAESVRLRAGATTYALPKVPAGTYTVLATFDGKEVEAGSLTLVEAEKVVLKCKKASLKCGR